MLRVRIEELKTLLALAVGDEDAILEGCDWVHHFSDLPRPGPMLTAALQTCSRAIMLLYGTEAVRQAGALPDRSERFFSRVTLGADMQGNEMHQTLFAAYDKLFVPPADVLA